MDKKDALPDKIISELILSNKSRLEIFRENKGMTKKELAIQSQLPEEYIDQLENTSQELITTELQKIAQILQIDSELLINTSDWIHQKDLWFLELIFRQHKEKVDSVRLKQQILNWMTWVLYRCRQEWAYNRINSIDILCQLNKKAEAIKRAQCRDKKYAPFREYFKKNQLSRFIEYQQAGKILSANSFVEWFLENRSKEITIPYVKQNQKNKLIQLAQKNNREFKKLLNAKAD